MPMTNQVQSNIKSMCLSELSCIITKNTKYFNLKARAILMNGKYLVSSIGRKQLIGVAGLGLSLFILTHMLGNLLLFFNDGGESYNRYGHALMSNKLIYVAELGLLFIFIAHIVFATYTTFKNKQARPVGYKKTAKGLKKTSWAQKTMMHQGIIILIFVVFHLITFKYGNFYTVSYNGEMMRDLYSLVVEVFQSPYYVVFYLFSVFLLGLHVGHGFASSIKTMGFNDPKYNLKIERLGKAYALLVTIGFMAQPIYIYIFK